MKKALLIVTVVLIASALTALPALALKPPVITLERVEVASMQPFFMTAAKTKDKAGKDIVYKGGSILNTAYILNIKNPNKEAMMLDELSFTISFDGIDVNTVTSYEDAWIPGGKTNQLRVIATNEARPTLLSLMVGAPNVARLQELKMKPPAMVKKWWDNIPDFAFPIGLTNGTALFTDEKGKQMRVAFTATFGKAAKAPAPAKKEKGSGKK
jgi:hypothetical protein